VKERFLYFHGDKALTASVDLLGTTASLCVLTLIIILAIRSHFKNGNRATAYVWQGGYILLIYLCSLKKYWCYRRNLCRKTNPNQNLSSGIAPTQRAHSKQSIQTITYTDYERRGRERH